MRFLLLFAALLMLGSAARAADMSAERPAGRSCSYFENIWLFGDPTDCPGDETVPACDDPRVVRAAKRFVARAEDVYTTAEIADLALIREQPQPFANPSPLARRYCTGIATLARGTRTEAYWFVEEDSGFVGIPWKVYVCLMGHDDWRVYDGRCRVARPGLLN